MANPYLKVAMADQVRADSPILGFEQPPAPAKDDRDKPLPVTPPLTPTSPQLGSPSQSHSISQSYSVPLPPSFTRLPIHPKPKQTNHSPSSSIHSRTSASSLPYTHSLTMHTRTSSQSSLSSSPSLSRRPSLARQPSLPLLGETSILGLPPVPQSPQFQVQQQAFARSRSTSLASLSSLYHLPTGYEPVSPQRRQSRYPTSQLQQNLSQSSLSGVLTPPSLGSVRDAVYLDSEEVRERLDELLAAAAIDEPGSGSVESYPGYVVDSYASKSAEGTEEDFGQIIEVSPIQEVLEITSADGEILAFPVPPLSPPLTPGYYQTPYASSSQIYLGPAGASTPPRPAPAPPLALDEDVVDEHVQELFFRPKTVHASTPTPTPVPSSSTTEKDEKSRWSMSSSVDLPLHFGKKDAMVVEGGRRRSASMASMQSKEKMEKEGKRKRLVSFISRLGGGKEEEHERVCVGVLEECREEEEVQMPLTPALSSEAMPVREVQEGEGEEGEDLGEEWEEDLLLVKHAHTHAYPVPDVVDLSFEPAVGPGALSSSRTSVRDSVELRQERYRASLESDDEDDVVPPRRDEPTGRRSTDDWRRGSIVGAPRSSPASPQKVKPVQQGRLRSMSSLSSLNLMSRMGNQIPPSPLPSATMTTAKPASSLRTFITRMGLVSVPPPSPKMATSVALPRRSLVLTQSEGKRKLVISGVEDDEAYDAVRRWCESFGEVRKFSRKRERGEGHVVVVDFKERKVADMVCRLQAQVHIKGAGSVNLSWVSKK